MVRIVSSILILVLSACVTTAPEFDPRSGPEPILIWIQTNPWAMVIGADTPRLAVYVDGTVVYLEHRKKKLPVYKHVKLSAEHLERMVWDIRALGDYSTWKSHYNVAPNVTDQPRTKFYVRLDEKVAWTDVYGLMVEGTRLPAYTVLPLETERDQPPPSVTKLLDYCSNLKFDNATEWVPMYVEVMVWPYEYAPDESIHWPSEWPGLESPQSMQRGDSYSIFLPGDELGELRKFLRTRKTKGAVEIGGRKWAAEYRLKFPSEPVWQEAFRRR